MTATSAPLANREVASITAIINILLLDEKQTSEGARWGVTPLNATHRPEHNWLANFNGVVPIPVTSTIENAVNLCALDAYCVIEIDKLKLTDTYYLNRSKTKLIGKVNNRITYLVGAGNSGAFFEIETGTQEIVIENLQMDGESTNYGVDPIAGIIVYGKDINKVALLSNHIHHLHSDEYANAIAIYGTGDTDSSAIQNVIIDANIVEDMHTGSSESVVVNGNVKHWEITNNQVTRINNIAIGAIGGEGTSPVQIVNGKTRPGELDAARYGFIEGNTVTDMTTLSNPAYGNQHSWAGAIYIDGARLIYITNNTVTKAEWAYDIGAENCVITSDILLENNTAIDSYYGDFIIGGYAQGGFLDQPAIECDPTISIDEHEGHGNVDNITVKNNQFTTLSPRINVIELSNRIRQTILIHEGISAQHPDGVVTGDQNSIRIVE